MGPSGSGKTTLGKHLAENLGFPFTDLDDLYWLPNWIIRPSKEFSSLIEDATSSDCWIICGNQSKYRHLFWPKADTIIWLDLPLYLLLWRVLRRSIKNLFFKDEICNGNQETLRQFFSSQSIVLWLLKSYFRRRRDYLMEMKTRTNVKWIHTRKSRSIRFLLPDN